jgi:N-acylethanolamine-hydrolysing acid amidase
MNVFAAIAEDGQFTGFLIRDTLSQDDITFALAVSKLAHTHVIAPSYIIVGGIDEAAVITRGRAIALDIWYLNASAADNRWFLVETNYDHWTSPPPNDDRRDPAESALRKVGRANISPDELFQVLSTHPVLNDNTVYTTVMSASLPEVYQSWIRDP